MEEQYVTIITSMVFNATFNTISAISWRSGKETGLQRETTDLP